MKNQKYQQSSHRKMPVQITIKVVKYRVSCSMLVFNSVPTTSPGCRKFSKPPIFSIVEVFDSPILFETSL